MTFAPQELLDLQAYWRSKGGASLGIVGNAAHTKGYHLGRDRIYDGSGPGLGDADYSVKTARDRAGLTNAAAAIDLGKLDGSYVKLRDFSKWLVARGRANAPGTSQMREIIYSPDGKVVLRWDRERGASSAPRAGEADDSHLTHTHISFYRDTQAKDKVPIFAPYFAPPVPPVTPEDPTMPVLTSYIPGQVATLKPTSNVRVAPAVTAQLIRTVPAGATEKWTVTGWVKGGVDPDGGSDQWLTRWAGGRWEYTAKANVSAGPTPPLDTSPYTQADLEAAKTESSRTGYNDGLTAAGAAVAAVPRR